MKMIKKNAGRVPGILTLCLLLLTPVFSQLTATEALGGGRRAVITDITQVYDTISKVTCISWTWATREQRSLAARENWGDFRPTNGDEGEIVFLAFHCANKSRIYVLKMGKYFVPMGESGIKILDGSVGSGEVKDASVTAQTLYDKGNACYRAADYKCSIGEYTKALEIMPKDSYILVNRGNAYDQMGNSAEAIADYGRAIAADPKNVDAYFNRARICTRLKQGDTRAIDDLTKAIELTPDADSYFVRAENYSFRGVPGDLERAVSDYTKVISLNPNYPSVYKLRALTYRKLKRISEAEADEKLEPANKKP